MSLNKIYHKIGPINKDILLESEYKLEKRRVKNKKIMRIAVSTCILIGLLIVILPFTLNHTKPKSILGSEGTLPGATEINPAIMYNGTIYYWEKLAWLNSQGHKQDPPEGYKYVGDIQHIEGDKLEQDFQFIAKFSATGQVYYNKNNPNNVYIRITTYWLEHTFIIFKQKD